MQTIDQMRDEIAAITKRGIGMPMAGMLYWLAMAVFGAKLTPHNAALVMFIATGVVFPIGWWLTKLAGGNLMHKGHPLSSLGMILNFVQLAYWPLVIVVFHRDPMLVPLALGSLFGSHFLPYSWLYKSRGYAFLAIGTAVVATAGIFVFRRPLYDLVPLLAAACYAVTVAMLLSEIRALTPKERSA